MPRRASSLCETFLRSAARKSPNWRRTAPDGRSEEHTSELQSHSDLVCRLLLEKKKKHTTNRHVQNTRSNHDNITQPANDPQKNSKYTRRMEDQEGMTTVRYNHERA